MEIRELLYPLEERDVLVNDAILPNDWRLPITQHLENPRHDVYRKLKYIALKYTMQGGLLHRRSVDATLDKCMGEADLALYEVHEGVCVEPIRQERK